MSHEDPFAGDVGAFPDLTVCGDMLQENPSSRDAGVLPDLAVHGDLLQAGGDCTTRNGAGNLSDTMADSTERNVGMDDNSNDRRGTEDGHIENMKDAVEVPTQCATNRPRKRGQAAMVLHEAMIESMHGYVSDGVLNLTPYEVVSKLKSVAEQLGFKMIVQRSKYVYPQDRRFVSKCTFICYGSADDPCGFELTLRGTVNMKSCTNINGNIFDIGKLEELPAICRGRSANGAAQTACT